MVLSGVHSFKNQRKKQKHGFPIKDFGNDGGVDSRLLISGMTKRRALDGRPSHILSLTSTQEAGEGRRGPFSVRENYNGPGECAAREGSYS